MNNFNTRKTTQGTVRINYKNDFSKRKIAMEATKLLPVELWFHISRNDFCICRELRKTFKAFNEFIKANRGILTKFFERVSTNTFGVNFSLMREGIRPIRENNLPIFIGKDGLFWNQKSCRIKKPFEVKLDGTLKYAKHSRGIFLIRDTGDYTYINKFEKMVAKYCDGVSSHQNDKEKTYVITISLEMIIWMRRNDFVFQKAVNTNGSILFNANEREDLPKKLLHEGYFE